MDFAMWHPLALLTFRAMEFYTYFKLLDGTSRKKLIPGPQTRISGGPVSICLLLQAFMLDMVEDHALDEYKTVMVWWYNLHAETAKAARVAMAARRTQ